MKKFIFKLLPLLALITTWPCWSAPLPQPPQVPSTCFDNANLCSNTLIYKEQNTNIIQIKIFLQVPLADYANAEKAASKYFEFNHWVQFTQGSSAVIMEQSAPLPHTSANTSCGPDDFFHYANYLVSAPFPLNRVRVREVTCYRREMDSQENLLVYSFDLVPGIHNNLPESDPRFQTLAGAEGVTIKRGNIFVVTDRENDRYLLTMVIDYAPTFAILPSVAAAYIQRAMVDLASGMYGL